MQSNLETALVNINKHICKVNHENYMSTPYCHTAIRKRKGKHPRYYYKHAYDLLWDGVHGPDTTKDKWADAIQGAIRSIREKRKTPDTEDKYSLLMHCIKIKSPVKFLLNEQYVFVDGNISFLCVLSCSSEEA